MFKMTLNNNNTRPITIAKNITIATAFAASLLGMSVAKAAGDAVNGKQLSQTCLGCHGAPGLRNPGPVYSIPMLGAQNEEYLIEALKGYKNKTRPHKTMQAQAASLSDQDMKDIAAYFSGIDGKGKTSAINQKKIAAGKALAGSCASCHGADGASTTSPTFPKLAGQYESYLVHALKEYRSGERQNGIMSGFASGLSIDEIEALAAWFASQEVDGVTAPKTTIFKF